MKTRLGINLSSIEIHRLMDGVIRRTKRMIKGRNTTGYYIPVEFGKTTMGGSKK